MGRRSGSVRCPHCRRFTFPKGKPCKWCGRELTVASAEEIMLKHDSDHETISYFPRSIVAQMLNEAREQVLTSMKRGKKVWICLDCGMMATGTIPMYHNKDHTFKFKGILIEFPEGKGGSSE